MMWNTLYESRKYLTEWHSEVPSTELRCLLASGVVRRCNALDLGCGAGTEAVFLAEQGFNVSAVDISSKAVELTAKRAASRDVVVKAIEADVTDTGLQPAQFGFINDRSCFNVLGPYLWSAYAREAHRLMTEGGILLIRALGNGQRQRMKGNGFIAASDFAALFHGLFDILGIQELAADEGHSHMPYRIAILRKRA